jgi:hypothetical protein
MKAAIMKVGTQSSYYYFIKETKKIKGTELSTGQIITFREQQHGSRWQKGKIWKMSGNMPCVELL